MLMRFSSWRLRRSPTPVRRSRPSTQGISIVEVLVSAILLVIVVLGTIGVMRITAQTSNLGRVNQFTNSRIASDIEQARAAANTLCTINLEKPLDSNCINSWKLRQMCNGTSSRTFAGATQDRLANFDENGWLSGSGIPQGSRIRRNLIDQATVLVLEYRDRDNNNRLVHRAEVIPPAVGYCSCRADNPITRDAKGVTVCR